MTLYLENLFYLGNPSPSITMSFENMKNELLQKEYNHACDIVKKLKENYPEKISAMYDDLSFSVSYDLNFISYLLIYLMIENNVGVKIDDKFIKVEKYDKECINKIQDYVLEFCKKEILRIKLMRKQQDIFFANLIDNELNINDLGNLTI